MPTSTGIQHASAPAGAHLTYYGGHVISNVRVTQVLYGSGTYTPEVSSTGSQSIASFYAGVTNSPYFDWLSEYDTNINAANGHPGTNQLIGRGTFAGQTTISPLAANDGATIDDTNIQAELKRQIASGALPTPTANTLLAVYFPAGKTITQGGSASGVQFCAYHGTVAASGSIPEFYYSVLPDFTTGGMSVGCGGGTRYQNETSVSSHELVESVTDAEVGLATVLAPPLAWYDNTNGEIGDICNAQQGTVVGGDGATYTVQKEFSNHYNNCIVTAPAPASDFSIAANPSTVTVTAGSAGTSSISTAVTSGSAQTVSLSASGVPSGVTASFSPASVTAGGSSTLTLSTTTSATPGTYPITVTGTGSSATHTTAVSLTINAGAPANNFSISANPSAVTVTAGSAGTSTISTAVTSGSAQTVSLSASGVPSGVTASFNPASVTAGGSSTLTLSTTTSASSGTITVTGTAPAESHSVSVALTVNGSTGGGVVNGGFETGNLSGWTPSGTESVTTSTPHSGTYADLSGASTATNGDSSITQTFTVPSGFAQLSFWYKMTCPDTVTYDWATATLRDNTASTTATVLPKTCATNSAYVQVLSAVTAGHSYTLTLTSHDDNYPGDPSYTKYDDVTLLAPPPPQTLTNGGFETGNLSGWTPSGTESVTTSTPHSGTYADLSGASTATNGDSSITQTFTAPAGTSKLTFWYKMTCPDTVTYDWATATLRDNTAGTTATVLPKTCATNSAYVQVTATVIAGHSYTLTLTSHDDNYPGDPSYTEYDDVALS